MTSAAHHRGIAWMCLTALMWAVTDAIAKELGQTYPNVQVVWGRFFFNALIVVVIFAPTLGSTLRTIAPGLQLVRTTLLLTTIALIFFSLRSLPLVTATAVFFLAPIFVTTLAMTLLRERVGPRRLIGVLIGFAGALIIIRPGTGMMQLAALLPLAAAISSALYQIATRKVSFLDSTTTSLLYAVLGGAAVTTALLPLHWRSPDVVGWVGLVTMGLTGGLAQLALIRALSLAPASVVAPYHYTSLVWVAIIGYAVFGDMPDGWTWLGALVIAASGIYVLRQSHSKLPEPSDELQK